MKKILSYILPAALAVCATGCHDAEYLPAGEKYSDLGVHAFFAESTDVAGIGNTSAAFSKTDSKKITVTPTLTAKSEQDAVFNIVADQAVLDKFNKEQGSEYRLILEDMYSIPKTVTILAGEYSTPIEIELFKIAPEREGIAYAIPIRLEKVSGDAEVTSTTSQFVVATSVEIIDALPVFNGASGLRVSNFNGTFDQFTVELKLQVSNTSNRNRDIFMVPDTKDGELMFRFEDPQSDQDGTPAHALVQFQGIHDYLNPGSEHYIHKNKWQHYAVTYDGTNVTIYVNGANAGSKPIAKSVVNNGVFPELTFMGIGGWNGQWAPGDIWWSGCQTMVTEARIWSIARSESQIRNNMKTVPPDSQGLEGYWRVSRGSYDAEKGEFKDLTGKGHPMKTTKSYTWKENISSEDEKTDW